MAAERRTPKRLLARPSSEVLVWRALASRPRGEAPSIEALAAETGRSARHVYRCLASLERDGWIARQTQPGRATRYAVRVTPDEMSPLTKCQGCQDVRGDVTPDKMSGVEGPHKEVKQKQQKQKKKKKKKQERQKQQRASDGERPEETAPKMRQRILIPTQALIPLPPVEPRTPGILTPEELPGGARALAVRLEQAVPGLCDLLVRQLATSSSDGEREVGALLRLDEMLRSDRTRKREGLTRRWRNPLGLFRDLCRRLEPSEIHMIQARELIKQHRSDGRREGGEPTALGDAFREVGKR